MLKGKYTYLIRQNLFLDELFILFVHAVWRLEWEMSPSLIFHCVVPIGGANCKVPEPWGGRALLEETHLWGGLGGLTVWPRLYSFSLALPSPPSFMGMK